MTYSKKKNLFKLKTVNVFPYIYNHIIKFYGWYL